MKFTKIAILFTFVSFSMLAARGVRATLIPSPDGLTVYDTVLHVNWLANANLPAPANNMQFGLNINPDGSMNFTTAAQWIAALNSMNGGLGYLGHHNWQLPTSPHTDASCNTTGPMPYQNSFGYGCVNSDMGSLFNSSLGLRYPNTAVAIPTASVGPFTNLQPYLYWTDTLSGNNAGGYDTFSFNTGWRGSNVDDHYIYALPMIPGKLPGTPPASGSGLQVNPGGQTVYDPVTNVTWLANGNLAKTQTFGAQCTNYEPVGRPNYFPPGIPCIAADGSMSRTTATNWLAGMNANGGWLGQTNWQLPVITDDAACGGFHCDGNPLGELFYSQLGLNKGNGVPTPNSGTGPFHNIQPYLYWSSCQPVSGPSPCLAVLTDGITPAPAPGFEFSFSFGNGFEGTDVVGNNLYVTAYYPKTSPSDFDGDGKSDVSVYREIEGNWYVTNSSNSAVSGVHFGNVGDKIVPGDYDRDGKTDFAVWRPGDQTWYLFPSSGGFTGIKFGNATDLPAQGDFDGDGKTDIAVFRPSNGVWFIQPGSGAAVISTQFGQAGDKPVPGDYDGDGKTDIAVFRPSEGNWYFLKSTAGFSGIHFGNPTDKVVPGDYDGDGKTDPAVYRDGTWYLFQSTAGFTAIPFGIASDIPAPGDFDGDGKTDLSVFRPSSGAWFQQRSTSGFFSTQFGQNGDKPVPAGYVPVQ